MNKLMRQFFLLAACLLIIVPYPFAIVHADPQPQTAPVHSAMTNTATLAQSILHSPLHTITDHTAVSATTTLQSIGGFGAVVEAVAISGTLAYVGEADQLTILDVSTPTQPTVLTRLPLSGEIRDIQVVGDYAFIANYARMLQVIDLHNALQPRLIGTLVTTGVLTKIQVVGNRVYLSSYNDGVYIVDISNPAAPQMLGTTHVSLGSIDDLKVVGHYMYLPLGNGLMILDITQPTTPTVVGTFDTINNGLGNAIGIDVVGQIAYLANGIHGLQLFNISDPTNPRYIGGFDTKSFARNVQVIGTRAYVADEGDGMLVIDVSDPTTPGLLSAFSTGEIAYSLSVVHDLVYITNFYNGLQIADISDPLTTKLIGRYSIEGNSQAVSVHNGFAYIVAGHDGLDIFDIHTPSRVVSAARLALSGSANTIQVVDHTAYIGDNENGMLRIVDVSAPSHPWLRSSITTVQSVLGLKVVGTRVYIAGIGGWQIIDTSDLDHPTLLGKGNAQQVAQAIEVVGNIAFVDAGTGDLTLFDSTDPKNIQLLGSAKTNEYITSIAVAGAVAYVTTVPNSNPCPKYDTTCMAKSGLRIFDIHDLAHPSLQGSYDIPYGAKDIHVIGSLAYIAARGQGVQIVDVSDPTNPFLQASTSILGEASSLQVVKNLVYVTGSHAGLHILGTTNQFKQSDATIPTSGGSATNADGTVQLLFATDTFTNSVTVLQADTLPQDASDQSVLRQFLVEARTASGRAITQSSKPYTMQIQYDDEQTAVLSTSATPPNVQLWDGSQWVDALPCDVCSVETANHTITVQSTFFTKVQLVRAAPQTATATISLNTATSTVSEHEGVATITAILSEPLSIPVQVDYATSDGTATADQDYGATDGTLSFAPGATHATFSVPIVNDTIHEADETVYLTLRNPVGATLGGTTRATVTIVDDDLGTASTSHIYLPLVRR